MFLYQFITVTFELFDLNDKSKKKINLNNAQKRVVQHFD